MNTKSPRRGVLVLAAGALLLSSWQADAGQHTPIEPVPQYLFSPVPGPPRPSAAAPERQRLVSLSPLVGPMLPEAAQRPRPPGPPRRALKQRPVAVVVRPKPTSSGTSVRTTFSRSIKGKASWYCNYDDPHYVRSVCHHSYPDDGGADLYAAACGKLRTAMGSKWRGKTVHVVGNGRAVNVRLIDWCGSTDKTIDLYRDSMDRLGPSSGGYNVVVSW